MDREHLLWITISSYYYFYLIYCLTVDKRLLRTLEREDFYPVISCFVHTKIGGFTKEFIEVCFISPCLFTFF